LGFWGDMTDESAKNYNSYVKLAKNDMGINLELLKNGPLVAVMNRGQGSWIHGQGKPVADDKNWGAGRDAFEEVLDSIEVFIQESKDRKNGGTGYVSGSPAPKRSGEIILGRETASY
jgi:hypothetical protein